MKNNEKEFLILRIDDSYNTNNKDLKAMASDGWRMNLNLHPSIEDGYIVYHREVIKKFKIKNHVQRTVNKNNRNLTYESLDIDFINDSKDIWMHKQIKFDNEVYQNPVRYGNDRLMKKYSKNLVIYYDQLKKTIYELEQYFDRLNSKKTK